MSINAFKNLESEELGGDLIKIIINFVDYTKNEKNYCDDAVLDTARLYDYIISFNPIEEELSVFGEYCFERAWQLYDKQKSKLFKDKSFDDLIEEMKKESEECTFKCLKEKHKELGDYQLWIYKIRIYNFYSLFQVFF